MNLLKKMLVTAAISALPISSVNADNVAGIDVYGYFQTQLWHYKYTTKSVFSMGPFGNFTMKDTSRSTSSEVSELDLFLNKQISQKISALIDLQFLNNFSTAKSWGDLNVDEAWVKFNLDRAFVIKTGFIVPTFNNFNEIKSKFPLIPYVFRPIIYESNNTVAGPDIYLPQHAAIQINGTFNLPVLKIDYALFGGNSDFIIKKADFAMNPSGTDSTNFKLGGGRLGMRVSNVKLGVSSSYDYYGNGDVNSYLAYASDTSLKPLGRMPRTRVGADLSFSVLGFNFEAEAVRVMVNAKGSEKKKLDAIVNSTGSSFFPIHKDLKKDFAYGALTYTFLENYDITGMLGYIRDHATSINPSYEWSACAGYHVNDAVTIKAQIKNVFTNPEEKGSYTKMNLLYTGAAVSVFF